MPLWQLYNKIEEEGELTVTMAAPMAGPYDVNVTAFGILSQPTLSVPSFMADFGYAYAKAYDKNYPLLSMNLTRLSYLLCLMALLLES